MTSKQRTVIWIGLIIVALNLVTKWSSIKSIVFNGAGITSAPAPATTTPQGAGQNNGVQPSPQPNPSPTPVSTRAVVL